MSSDEKKPAKRNQQPSGLTLDLPELEHHLLAAHAVNDIDALAGLYLKAGEKAEAAGNIDAACFYYTHAYVFALEGGNECAGEIRDCLARYGREPEQE